MAELVNLKVQENVRRYDLNSSEQIVFGDGTKNYNKLQNKPSIENVELIGNKDFEDLGLTALTNMEIEELLH